jgi:hypothetical protein
MKYRKLRIAWSLGWGVTCVLLVALWVRSYWRADDLARFQGGNMYLVESAHGSLGLLCSRSLGAPNMGAFVTAPLDATWYRHSVFGWDETYDPNMAYVPHWLLALLLLAPAGVPWMRGIPSRFSLRTLLIATTLVAVLLGLVVWLVT